MRKWSETVGVVLGFIFMVKKLVSPEEKGIPIFL